MYIYTYTCVCICVYVYKYVDICAHKYMNKIIIIIKYEIEKFVMFVI